MNIDEQFIEGQVSDARHQIQRGLTSLFMAEDRMRRQINPRTTDANKLFELRKQIAQLVHTALGEPPCKSPPTILN